MANLHWYLYGFVMGTFKYIPATFLVMESMRLASEEPFNFLEVFLTTFVGCIVSMAFFYFTSDFLMARAANKRVVLRNKAIREGVELKRKKIFTRTNKLMVKVKRKFGVYAFTFIVPLIFSIPLGSILCAKFYGHHKKTYLLMVINMGIYGVVSSVLMVFIYG
jgi:hypothetical protein